MMKKAMLRIACVASALALALAMGGCAQQDAATDEQSTSSKYMAQVNQIMDELSTQLEDFEDAVTRGDIVSMKTKAAEALEVIDDLNDLEVPEVLNEVHASYVEGCDSLKQALESYVDLYADIETATEEHPFDFGSYDELLGNIQGLYDAGVELLESADSKAAEL